MLMPDLKFDVVISQLEHKEIITSFARPTRLIAIYGYANQLQGNCNNHNAVPLSVSRSLYYN